MRRLLLIPALLGLIRITARPAQGHEPVPAAVAPAGFAQVTNAGSATSSLHRVDWNGTSAPIAAYEEESPLAQVTMSGLMS